MAEETTLSKNALKNVIGLIESALEITDRIDENEAGDTHDNLAAALTSARKEFNRKDTLDTDAVIGHYAFWGNDLYPYVLSGIITKVLGGGEYEIGSYGVGFRFKPFAVIEPIRGGVVHNALKQLTEDFRAAKDKLHEEFMVKAYEALPELKAKRSKSGTRK